MDIHTLRKIAGREEIDYQFLLSALRDYSHPRDKISSWLQSGELLRIKKGLYIFGNNVLALEWFNFQQFQQDWQDKSPDLLENLHGYDWVIVILTGKK